MPASLPPLAAEDHVCDPCSVAYLGTRIDDAVAVIAGLPGAVADAIGAIPPEARRVRPAPDVWSVAEYLCHVRDVYVSFTIRLHRVRTEQEPVLEPMFNDLRPAASGTTTATSRPRSASWWPPRPGSATRSGAQKTGTAWGPDCRANGAPRAGWSARRCTKVSITSATSADLALSWSSPRL